MSRHEVLQWVNSKVNEKLTKIEALSSGVAYCQMLEQLYPNCIGVKRIKVNAKMEHEYLHNFKLLQAAFGNLKIDKVVPVDRLLKGRFQDNLEFIQWFKKFYEEHAKGKSIDIGTENTSPVNDVKKKMKSRSNSCKNLSKRSPSPSAVTVLETQKEKITLDIAALDKDRNFYFSKLTEIEKILLEAIDTDIKVDWCKRALAVLYDNCNDNGGDEEGAEGNIENDPLGNSGEVEIDN